MQRSFPLFGTLALVLGGTALTLAVVHVFAGPFAPQQNTGVAVGTMAAEIVQAAKEKLAGRPPPDPKAVPWTIDRILEMICALGAALALVLACVAGIRREPVRLWAGAVALGSAAILFQFFVMLAFGLLAILLIWVILQSLPDWLTG